eukprot:2432239-Pleurochrysis_carterae.AAC.1
MHGCDEVDAHVSVSGSVRRCKPMCACSDASDHVVARVRVPKPHTPTRERPCVCPGVATPVRERPRANARVCTLMRMRPYAYACGPATICVRSCAGAPTRVHTLVHERSQANANVQALECTRLRLGGIRLSARARVGAPAGGRTED